MNLFGIEEVVDDKYTTKVGVPQYLPSNKCPALHELFNDKKYKQLITNIERSDVPEDVKEFLRIAATRHIVFDYSKIADYYAHATADVQDLMEQSALIILDLDDAIANGYVKLSKEIRQIMMASGTPAKAKTEHDGGVYE